MAAFVVRLGSFVFNGAADVDGDRFICRDIDGWSGKPVELVTVDKPLSDGAVVAFGRYRGRELTLAGVGIASAGTHLFRVLQKIEDAVDHVAADTTLEVDETAGTQQLTVRLAGPLRTRLRLPRVVEFQVPLFAASPDKTAVP